MATAPVLSIELFYDGVWNIVTGDVYEGSLVITRGRASVDQQAASQQLTCMFRNDDGKYSPRNATSPLFGKIGRNTPIRATVSGSPRFYGEVAQWEPSWNENHTVKTVAIVANGILRRMGQGSTPASIALKDWVLSQSPSVYWPLGGAEGTTYSLSLGSTGGWKYEGISNPVFTYGKEFPGADWLDTGMELNATGSSAYMLGRVNSYDEAFVLDFVFQSPATAGIDANIGVLDIFIWNYIGDRIQFRLNDSANSGKAQVSFFAVDGSGDQSFLPTGVIPALLDNQLHTCRVSVEHTGGGNSIKLYIDGVLIESRVPTPIPDHAWGGTSHVQMFYSRFTGQTVVNLAHIAGWSNNNIAAVPAVTDYAAAANAYSGETAAARVTRIAGLAGTTATIVGTGSTAMGPQAAETRLQQLRDAEQTDFGILAESRTAFALRYRTRASMYNQTPVAVLDYVGRQVAPPFQPVDDDQQTHNDVTVSRRGGGNYQLVKTAGALSTQAPPNGVGPYEDSVTINLVSDEGLPAAAAWWLYQGTIDEPRFPQIAVNLSVGDINDAKATTLRALDIGDALQVVNLAGTDITTDVALIVLGYTETIKDKLQHQIIFNCATATGYTFAKWGSAAGSGPDRYDTEYSTLTAGIDATVTSFQVTSPATALWTTVGAEFPFDINIGGERMTVYNITGSSSPQTFGPVARSQNGVAKAQASGAAVRLWKTPRYGY